MSEVKKVKCYECRNQQECQGGVYGCRANPKYKDDNIRFPDYNVLDRCDAHNANGDCKDFERISFFGCFIPIIIFACIVLFMVIHVW